MRYQHAAKLHNGDQVYVHKNYTGLGLAMVGKVVNVYERLDLHNTVMVDILLENGVFIANLTHRNLV
jgi:hypothetical protein